MTDVRILVRTKPELEHYTVPADQIPPGYIKIHLKDHGDFYASTEWLAGTRDAGYRHAEFPAEVRRVFRTFIEAFVGVYERTLEEWEDGFRKDRRPWSEIAIWQCYADALKRFTSHLSLDPRDHEKRREVFRVIRAIENQSPDIIQAIKTGKAKLGNAGSVMPKRVREITTWLCSDETNELLNDRTEALRRMLNGPGLAGPDRVSLEALFAPNSFDANLDADFHPGDLVASADVILAVDIDTNREFLVYGRELLAQIAESDTSLHAAVLRVDLDMHSKTDDLERLVALVQVVKGRHEYQS
jgi:hypothetical protein